MTALVTGGSRGIGRAISLRLAATYAKVVIVNYLQHDLEAHRVKQEIESHGARCLLAKTNLAFPDEIDAMFDDLATHAQHIDVFIHCAAITTFKPLLAVKPNQWDLTMNVNARSFLLCVQRVAPMMKNGRIIALSSMGSRRAVPNYGAMGPTKAALESLVRCLAVELAPLNIMVNAVCGGLVETDSLNHFPKDDNLKEEYVRRHPLHKLASPEEVAEVVMSIMTHPTQLLSGQTIVADGGWSLL